MRGVSIAVSARKFAIPFECPCCGAPPDSEITLSMGRTRGLVFPYCGRCVAHVIAWESAGVPSAGAMLLGIIGAIVVGLWQGPLLGALVVVAVIPVAVVIRTAMQRRALASCRPACAGPGRAIAYLGWDGNASSFQFESPTYTARFAEQNGKRLVEPSPKLRQLIENFRVARLQVPTPVVAVTAIGTALDTDAWIARISEGGAATRRHAFERAMEALRDPDDRARIVAAAARLEAAATLDRATREELEHALVDVRLENLPDELEDAVVKIFEDRMRVMMGE